MASVELFYMKGGGAPNGAVQSGAGSTWTSACTCWALLIQCNIFNPFEMFRFTAFVAQLLIAVIVLSQKVTKLLNRGRAVYL